MKYLVIVEETKTGYSAFCPDLPGYVVTGSDKEKVRKNMKEAIAFHLEGMNQEGLEVPQPYSFSTCLEISA
jgi:predicted RNase H-like HicB family nuclease